MDFDALSIKPLTGLLDTRSSPDEITGGGLRWRQNFKTVGPRTLGRRPQWEKAFNQTPYNNQDLHDQLLALRVKFQVRQPITMLHSVDRGNGRYDLFAATESTIYLLRQATGNWKVIADGYGSGKTDGSATRFYASSIGDYVTFTNGVNPPFYYAMGIAALDGEFVSEFADLDLIGISRAGVTFSWNGINFFGDVTEDGDDKPYRLIWSAYNNPPSFDPAVDSSITGYFDMKKHERILAAAEFADLLLVYTTHGVWKVTVDSETVFKFKRIYSDDKNRKGCLKYRNTLVATTKYHMFLAEDDVYIFSPYYQKPENVAYMHYGSGTMMDNISSDYCNSTIAIATKDEVWFSYVENETADGLPSKTFVLNVDYEVCDYVDHGFTAFTNHYSNTSKTIRQFLIDNGICTEDGLADLGYGYGREGLPLLSLFETPEFIPAVIYTATPKVDGDATVEDYEAEEADSDSLCALLNGLRLEEICPKCAGRKMFLAVSSSDWCLKEIGNVFYREQCTNTTSAGSSGERGYASSVGAYILDGFDSILRPGTIGKEDATVSCNKLEVEAIAEVESSPATLQLRVGQSAQLTDPNTDNCALIWRSLSSKLLKCQSGKTAAQHVSANSQPSPTLEWRFEYSAPYLQFELKISGTGGQAKISRLTRNIRLNKIKNR